MIFYIVLISGSLYFILMIMFSLGWIRTRTFKREDQDHDIFCSVIVPVRNEERNLPVLLDSLSVQTYNKENYEVIIVDDNSVDSTYRIAEDFCNKKKNFSMLRLDGQQGKKEAIIQGVKTAKGKLIITTDADCRMSLDWLAVIAGFYSRYKPKMIICPVILCDDNTIFSQLQALEFLGLTGSAAGATGIHHPVMCNGAGLAWEKERFFEFEDILRRKFISGDDMFFMLALKKKYRKEIMYLRSTEATVYTKAEPVFKDFISQRMRWVSKGKGYDDPAVIISALIVYTINFVLLLLLVMMWFDAWYGILFLLLFTVKCITDLFFLNIISWFFKKQKLLLLLIPAQILYFLYVSFTGIAGMFGRYTWKGRRQ